MAVTNTPDKSEMKAMTSNRPVSEMVECEPCPFCGAATTLPPNTPYIRHPPNGCYFANHNIRFQNWQKRASSQAPSDDMVERITQSVLQTTWGYPGPSDPVVKSVREGVRAAIAAFQAVPASDEVGWQPIESAPKDTRVLVWWPIVAVDDDCNLTAKVVGGRALLSELTGNGYWNEPDELDSLNSNYFGDEEEFAQGPTHWRPLPEPPALKAQETGE